MECPADDQRVPARRVLLLGEGDFSFAKAYRTLHPTDDLVATSYDSAMEVTGKYPSTAKENLERLQRANVTVLHDVDATCLDANAALQKLTPFDEVRFTFPLADTRDSDLNPKLIQGLFRSVRPLLKPQGRVTLGIVDHGFYDWSYDLLKPSRANGFKMVSRQIWDPDGAYHQAGYGHQTTERAAKASPTDSYHTVEVSFVQDPRVNPDDEFLHSSDLSDDGGRLTRCYGKKKPGKDREPIAYHEWRMQQLLGEYPNPPTLPMSVSQLAKEQLARLLKHSRIDAGVHQQIIGLIEANQERQGWEHEAIFFYECPKVFEELRNNRYREAKNRLKRLSTCFAQDLDRTEPHPLHLPFCIYLKVIASDPGFVKARRPFQLFLNRLRLFTDVAFSRAQGLPMWGDGEGNDPHTTYLRVTTSQDAEQRQRLRQEYGEIDPSHLKRMLTYS